MRGKGDKTYNTLGTWIHFSHLENKQKTTATETFLKFSSSSNGNGNGSGGGGSGGGDHDTGDNSLVRITKSIAGLFNIEPYTTIMLFGIFDKMGTIDVSIII
jgi:hypothetical protein